MMSNVRVVGIALLLTLTVFGARWMWRQPTPANIARAIAQHEQQTAGVRAAAYTVTDVKTSGSYARFQVRKSEDNADPAFGYARRTAFGWKIIALGTVFPPDYSDELGIPTELWWSGYYQEESGR